MEMCVNALRKYTEYNCVEERRYQRHQSYPQGMSLMEQNEAEKGIPYANSWSASDLRKGYRTLGANYRFQQETNAMTSQMNQLSLQHSNVDIKSLSAVGRLDSSSRPTSVDSVDSLSVAGAAATLPRSNLPSVSEISEQQYDQSYPSDRQERLDSLRKGWQCI